MEGGFADYDTAGVDKDDIPFMIDPDTDAEDELDIKKSTRARIRCPQITSPCIYRNARDAPGVTVGKPLKPIRDDASDRK